MFSIALVVLLGVGAWAGNPGERARGAQSYLGLASFDDPESPGYSLLQASYDESNAGYHWEEQMNEFVKQGHSSKGRQRSVSAYEMFRGDQRAFDDFMHQFGRDKVCGLFVIVFWLRGRAHCR